MMLLLFLFSTSVPKLGAYMMIYAIHELQATRKLPGITHRLDIKKASLWISASLPMKKRHLGVSYSLPGLVDLTVLKRSSFKKILAQLSHRGYNGDLQGFVWIYRGYSWNYPT